MEGYYGILVPRCHSYDFILILIISGFMPNALPLFEEVNRKGKTQ